MTIIYTKVFSCNDCKADIHGRIYSNDTLSDQDQERYLEDLKQSHFDSTHLKCFKCGASIKRHEIAEGVPHESAMKPICRTCGKTIYGSD